MSGKSKASTTTYSLETNGANLKKPSEIVHDGIRSDGRRPLECRPAFLKTGAVTAAAGSAYAEFGGTKVIVSIFGPRESKKAQAYSDIGRLNCSVSFATFSTRVRSKLSQGIEDREYTMMLHKALEGAVMLHTFPKTTVDVFALVIESSGGDLPVVITCAALALADAGIMMFDLVSAVSLGMLMLIMLVAGILEGLLHEVGYVALTDAAKEMLWLRGFVGWLQMKLILHCDNQSAIHLAKNPVYHARTKHIDVKYHFISKKIERLVRCLKNSHTCNHADFLTKAVDGKKRKACSNGVGLKT